MIGGPSIKERYTRAMGASRLVVCDKPGDVDLLIAAGWINEGLATALYRLMSEFDVARGEMRVAGQEQARLARERADQLRQAAAGSKLAAKERLTGQAGPHRGELQAGRAAELAQALAGDAEQAALQARAFALLQLKTLASTKQAVFRYADQAATRKGLRRVTPADVATLSGKVIEALLDPLCSGCQGSGKVGAFPNLQLHTGRYSCGGSGRRAFEFAKDPTADEFGRWLVADLERKTSRVDQLMRRFLRQYQREGTPAFKADSDEAVSALQRRLVELRSTEAALD